MAFFAEAPRDFAHATFTPTKSRGEQLVARIEASELGPGSYTEGLSARWPFREERSPSRSSSVSAAMRQTQSRRAAADAAPAFGSSGARWRAWKQYGHHAGESWRSGVNHANLYVDGRDEASGVDVWREDWRDICEANGRHGLIKRSFNVRAAREGSAKSPFARVRPEGWHTRTQRGEEDVVVPVFDFSLPDPAANAEVLEARRGRTPRPRRQALSARHGSFSLSHHDHAARAVELHQLVAPAQAAPSTQQMAPPQVRRRGGGSDVGARTPPPPGVLSTLKAHQRGPQYDALTGRRLDRWRFAEPRRAAGPALEVSLDLAAAVEQVSS